MTEENIILDENLDETAGSPEEFNMASTGQRFVNYIIDLMAFYFLIFVVFFLLGTVGMTTIETATGEMPIVLNFVFVAIIIGYYTIIEGATGRSLGKYVTGTKIVTADGKKPSYGTAFKRSLSRIVPFEVFTAFLSSKRMWHDSWTDTWLIKAR